MGTHNNIQAKGNIKTIIISRTDAIGDVLLTLPLAALIKQYYPQVHLLFLGRSYTQVLIESYSYIDGFINWDKLDALSETEAVKVLQSYHADVFIHVYPKHKIASLAKKAKIPIRIGSSHRWYHWFTCTDKLNFARKKSNLHESCLNTLLLQPLNIPPIKNPQDLVQFAKLEIPTHTSPYTDLLSDKHFNIVLHPKSKGSAREWGLENFASLIELLPLDRYKIFITGTLGEKEFIQDKILNKYADRITDLTGKTNLSELIHFLSHADAIVAASTGPLHIGAFTGIHAIGIYPPIRPMHAGRWAPLGAHTKTFTIDRECKECQNGKECVCMQAVLPKNISDYLNSLKKFM